MTCEMNGSDCESSHLPFFTFSESVRKLTIKVSFLVACLTLPTLFCACGQRTAPHTQSIHKQTPNSQSSSPNSQLSIVNSQLDSLCLSFWDGFRLERTPDVRDIALPFNDFARMLSTVSVELGRQAVSRMMDKVACSAEWRELFVQQAETAFHDPNLPYRDDELYIPVLESLLSSADCTETEREQLRFELELVSRNRVGHEAGDFVFELADGRKQWLHELQAEWLLLFFYNPGCANCAEIKQSLAASPLLTELTVLGRLKVLAVYPDEDMEEWAADLATMPDEWLAAYDPVHALIDRNIYNLIAIPSLYLLDERKMVLVKDASTVEAIEVAINAHI